jgi:5S rRNA maturation endonuclease (ribonuclease M5)
VKRASRKSNLEFLKEDLYLVVEGEIDEMFISKIISFFPTKYNVRIRVANGNGNIPIHVNILKKIYSYSKIMVLYDLDATNNLDTITKYLKNKEVTLKKEDIFFVNPCIEHLFLLVKELNNDKFRMKKDYQPFFLKYYGISDYAGHLPQVEEMIEQINYQDFNNFIDNLKRLSDDDNDLPSSNFLRFINYIKK